MSKSPKPPKTPKTPKTPKSPGAEKKKDAPGKLKYGIFVINFEGRHLKPIANLFKQSLEEHSRRAVLGASRDEIVLDFLKEKAEQEKKAKESAKSPKGKQDKKEGKDKKEAKDKKGKADAKDKKGKGNVKDKEENEKDQKDEKKILQVVEKEEEVKPVIYPEMFVLDEKNFNQFFAKVRDYIGKSMEKSETIAKMIKTREEFDLLSYWEKTDGAGDVGGKDQKKGKGKGKEEGKKKGKDEEKSKGKGDKAKGKDDEKGKDKSKKKGEKGGKKGKGEGKEEDELECRSQEKTVIKLKEKFWSKIQPRLQNEDVQFKYIEDHPLDELDVYIILLGNFKNDIYYEMMK